MGETLFELDHLVRRFVAEIWLHNYWSDLDQWVRDEPQGKMFGVLLGVAMDGDYETQTSILRSPDAMENLSAAITLGRVKILKAFSGQLHGVWTRPSWAPSLLDHYSIAGESWRVQQALHHLTYEYQLAQRQGLTQHANTLKQRRTTISRSHARTIRSSTFITSITGRCLPLSEIWPKAPTGVGECCAPKLLSYAGEMRVKPIGIAEFWWGHPPRRSPAHVIEKKHWTSDEQSRSINFYLPCLHRCQPLLPFMLGDIET